jgi:hypothetical protein
MEDISVDESRSEASTSEVEITDSDRRFCWHTSSTVDHTAEKSLR